MGDGRNLNSGGDYNPPRGVTRGQTSIAWAFRLSRYSSSSKVLAVKSLALRVDEQKDEVLNSRNAFRRWR